MTHAQPRPPGSPASAGVLHTPNPIRPGTYADYAALAEHHYRAARPATLSRVLCIDHTRASATDRFLQRDPNPQPVAVLVESLPALSCAARDVATAQRYGPWLAPAARATLLNRELRVISRVVVHPQHRGSGLASRLVRHALASATTRFTEALAAMGHVQPFFANAGMTAYHRPPHRHDQRLLDALQSAGLPTHCLTQLTDTHARIDALPPATQRFLDRELHRWHRQTHRAQRAPADRDTQLRHAQSRLLLVPVYYLKDNTRCAGRTKHQ